MEKEIKDNGVIWYIGTKSECESIAAQMGYTPDDAANETITRSLGYKSIATQYKKATGEGGMLIRHGAAGQWCFQVREG